MKTKKRKTWRSKLTKKEVKHMKESGVHTLAQLDNNFKHQARMRKDYPDHSEPCWDCRTIAGKLGFDL